MAQSVAVIERVEDKLGLYFIPPGEKAMQWISCSLEIGPINAGIERKDRDEQAKADVDSVCEWWPGGTQHGIDDL